MKELLQFHGAPVVVSAGASGIGRACCEVFTELGARVIAIDVNSSLATTALETSSGISWPDSYHIGDVSVESDVQEIASQVSSKYGEIAALINVAGLPTKSPIDSMGSDLWSKVIDVSLKSVFMMTREFFPLIRSHSGSIVNVSSTYAFASRPGSSAYSAAKGAIVSFTRTTAIEASERGVRANCVCPGPVHSPSREKRFADGTDNLTTAGNRTLLRRLAQPNEIANLIAFLASDAASYVTGAAYVIDGGQLAHIGEFS